MDSFIESFRPLPLLFQNALTQWGGVVLRLILIIILAKLVLRFGYSLIDRIFKGKNNIITLGNKSETFSGLFKSLLRYLIIFVSLLMILKEFVDITPILAGAGIAGLAVGFGAQSLVKDIITGFFIIIEEQFSVGDHVTIDSYSGIVEHVGLRATKVRDFGGQLHIFPNSRIDIITNHSQGPQRALVDISVAYEENVDRVLEVLREICEKFSREYPAVREGPVVLGVADLADSEVIIRIMAKADPMQQWSIERELRRVIKNHFDQMGIEIPYPRRVVFTRSEKAGEGNLPGSEKI
ncbi:MAG: mechanosensitive ion channel family protein [Dethiobacter sp.]|jgi:small conductance mechanosensitive channel|nr:MAG: mechanosensitive ion channel family protein [Dethiobacter sp.]